MCHSILNAILTKLLLGKYGNGGASSSRWKFDRVSRLVHYGTPAGVHDCVYSACQHAHAKTCQSPSKNQAYWCMLHTQGNQCHSGDIDLDNHIAMITDYWYHFFSPLICGQTPKNAKILFSPYGATRTSRMTWCNSFRHRAPKVSFSAKMTKMPLVNLGLTECQTRLKSTQNNTFHSFSSSPCFLDIFSHFDSRWA